VKSQITAAFRKRYAALPEDIRKQARVAYGVFMVNPYHRSLFFKRVHETEPIFSARVGRRYRVVGLLEPDNVIVWFWIGPHEQYETLLANL